MVDESKVIQTIVLGSDWQEVLRNLVTEEEIDPLDLDIVRLTNAFTEYLQRIKKFDFYIPARFILIAAILLRMKAELMLVEKEEEVQIREGSLPTLDVSNIPQLGAPSDRKPTRKIMLDELIRALQKTVEFKQKKEEHGLRIRKAVAGLINEPTDIEKQIKRIFDQILKAGTITFSRLVPVWQRKEIVAAFVPLLHLAQRGKISCDQEEMFKEIYIKVK
ncbi:MAG: ScpA family protein [Candidatus Aenigmatarchaeota archaeon]